MFRCYLISCKDYKVRKEVLVKSFSELPALCLAEEQIDNPDEYAVYANYNSKIVADAEGVKGIEDSWEPDPVYQAGLAYACGYHD